jgi:hypothetical protein
MKRIDGSGGSSKKGEDACRRGEEGIATKRHKKSQRRKRGRGLKEKGHLSLLAWQVAQYKLSGLDIYLDLKVAAAALILVGVIRADLTGSCLGVLVAGALFEGRKVAVIYL